MAETIRTIDELELAMARDGYCYLINSKGIGGTRKVIRHPENYKASETMMDYPAYFHHGKMTEQEYKQF